MKADEVIAEVVKLCKSFGANEVTGCFHATSSDY